MHGTYESWWRLAVDVSSARALVWVVSLGREVELTKDAHLYFADRYLRLSDVHRAHHRFARADRLERKAEEHLGATGWDGPPRAVAMAMPRPAPLLMTHAVSDRRLDGPDDAA